MVAEHAHQLAAVSAELPIIDDLFEAVRSLLTNTATRLGPRRCAKVTRTCMSICWPRLNNPVMSSSSDSESSEKSTSMSMRK